MTLLKTIHLKGKRSCLVYFYVGFKLIGIPQFTLLSLLTVVKNFISVVPF